MRRWSLRTLQLLMIGVVLGSGLAVMAVIAPLPSGATTARDYKPDSQECRMLAMINNYRQKRNAPALKLSKSLGAASEHNSEDQARKKEMGHSDLRRNAERHGYDGGSLAENVGYDPNGGRAKLMFNAWIDSSGHRANILEGDFRAIGIARAKGGGAFYWTTIFGSERDQTIRC